MKGKGFFISLIAISFLASCSHKISPDKPFLTPTDFNLDSLPSSEINIPIQISLKPIYTLTEKNIDTVFTSPNYPDDWIQQDCDVRYKYTFRRSPLQMRASATTINLAFTGSYKIIGSTRVCLNGIAVSPWTPPCKCGFEEERKVNVSFAVNFNLLPDYKIGMNVRRLEPQPLNKCEVCFWGQDITKQVMDGLKNELDAAKQEIDKTYSIIDLKPYFQKIWDQLQAAYPVYESGWLQINPQKIHINNLFARNDSLNVYVGLSAKPVISFEKPREQNFTLPAIGDLSNKPGFNIFTDAVLHYDSLSRLMNQQLRGKNLDLNRGSVKKNFIIKDCRMYGAGNEKLIIRIDFGGSAEGTAYFIGKPNYDQRTHTVEIKDLDFDIKTKDKFLRTAEWLFNKKILNTISDYAKFNISDLIDSVKLNLNEQLNREWMKGIRGYGNISDINLVGVYPLINFLVVRSNCKGLFFLKVEGADLGF